MSPAPLYEILTQFLDHFKSTGPTVHRLPSYLSWQRIHLQCRRPQFDSWVRKIPWRRERLPIPVFLGFPCGSAGKESSCNVGTLGLIPELGRSPGEGKGYPLQYSGLENSMDCIVHGVAKSQTQLSNSHFHFSLSTGPTVSSLPYTKRKLNKMVHEWVSSERTPCRSLCQRTKAFYSRGGNLDHNIATRNVSMDLGAYL